LLYAGEHGTRHKLGDCTQRELAVTISKDEQKGDWSRALTPEQLDYAATDAEVLRPLFAALTEKIRVAELHGAADVERRSLPGVVWLSNSGVVFDRDRWDGLAVEAKADADRLAEELDALAPKPSQPGLFGGGWKWDSPEQVKDVFATLGFELE